MAKDSCDALRCSRSLQRNALLRQLTVLHTGQARWDTERPILARAQADVAYMLHVYSLTSDLYPTQRTVSGPGQW